MAAREDETEVVVLDLLFLWFLVNARLKLEREVRLCGVEARPTAYPVYGLEACG